MPGLKKYTKIDMETVREGVAKGLSERAIAGTHGYTTTGVTKAIRRAKNPQERRVGSGRKSVANREQMEETATANPQLSVADFAKQSRVSKSTAHRVLRGKEGVKPLEGSPSTVLTPQQKQKRLEARQKWGRAL